MAHKIQFRRDTAANWTATDPILAQGELGIEIDLPNKIKIGDGTSLWSALPYYAGAVAAASDVTYDNTTSGLTAEDVQDAIDEIVATTACKEDAFTGIETPSNFTVSYDATTRVFTVVVSADTNVFIAGVCHVIAAGSYVQTAHADTTAVYWCYVNSSGAFAVGASAPIGSIALTSYAYYNATTNLGMHFDERHPNTWPASIHAYEHFTNGAVLKSGGTVSGYTLASATSADMQYDIDSTIFYDESITHSLDALTGADGAYTYWYRSGSDAAGEWSWATGANLPFPVSGTEAQYNMLNAGTWSLANMTTNNQWMVVWVIATNAYGGGAHRYVNIVGQALYTTLASAQAADFLTAISWGTLPFQEICPLAKIIVAYGNTAGNDYSYQSVTLLRGTNAALTATVSPTVHNALAGRSDAGAHPASAVTVDTTNFGGILSSADDTTQKALDTLDDIKLDELGAPTDVTTLNATTSAHGLLPKLGGGTTNYLRADGTWATPSGSGGADLDTIQRSMFFQEGVTVIRDGQYIYDLIVSIVATDTVAGAGKYVTTETPNRIKNVYFDYVQWYPSYGTYGQVSFKMYFETYSGGTYELGTAQLASRAASGDTTVTYSYTDTRTGLYWTIVFDVSAMDTSVYTGSLANSQLHPSVVQGGGRLLDAKATDKHRVADAYPSGAHSSFLAGGPIRWIKLVIEDDSANLWHHSNGELRKVIMKYGRNNSGTLTLSPRLEDSYGSNTYSYSWISLTGSTSDYILTYSTDSSTYGKFTITAAYDGTMNWDTTDGAQVQLSPAVIQAAYNDYLACQRCTPWRILYSVTRTDSNTFAKTGLETTLPVGSHVRSYSGTTRPATTSTDWKHHYVSAVGTNAVDVIGEEIPTGGTTLFVEYSTMPEVTMWKPTRKLTGYWAAATGTGLIANAYYSGNTLESGEKTARLIGACQIRSGTADTGATQPTIMITCGGTDLLGSALTVNATETNTGVIASGQELSPDEIIDVDCESTGTNANSYNLRMRFLIARHI